MTKDELKKILFNIRKIIIYRNIFNDDAVKKFIKIIDTLCQDKPQEEAIYELYGDLYDILTKYAIKNAVYKNLWRSKINELIKEDENIFSLLSEKYGSEYIEKSLKITVMSELSVIKELADTDLKEVIKDVLSIEIPSWESIVGGICHENNIDILNYKTVKEISDYYSTNGCGLFNKYKAFRWNNGELAGIDNPDPILFDDLIGYEEEQKIVIDNTEAFIRGLPASNILLYGDRGTGKSSTVKATLNMFSERGLRLIEVTREDVMELNKIISTISRRGLKFILFLDDLSFEENETEYKILKSTLEGGIEKLPDNIIIYATSNRRHMVREYLDDSEQNELHLRDTKEEKLSLSDRFGITITFTSPDQEKYLRIVESLAKKYNIDVDLHTLREKSLRWCTWHNGRSPRSARQFIDYMRSH